MMTVFPIYIIIIPFAIAFIISCLPGLKKIYRKSLVFLATFIPLILTLFLVRPVWKGKVFSYWLGNWQPLEDWAVGIGMVIDPLSLFMGIIIAISTFLSVIYSFKYMEKDQGVYKYYTLFLILTGGMFAFVFSADLFNMYVFLEVITVAAISLTIFREDKPEAVEAGFKYLVTGSTGSAFVLLGIILIYSETGTLNLAQVGMVLAEGYNPVVIFALVSFLTGFGVKGYLVPLHMWSPDVYKAAPSSISMVFSGVLSKVGIYALIRVLYYIFRVIELPPVQNLIIIWGTLTMVIGVVMALLQHDFKRLLAFHSVSQIGYIMTAIGMGMIGGVTAGLFHFLNHALFKSLLFLTAGAVSYRTGTTDLSRLGGLAGKMPWTFTFFTVGAFSISGIPPFNGFASKWMIYNTTLAAGYYPVTIIAILVSVLTLASFVKVMHSVFLGRSSTMVSRSISEVPFPMLFSMGSLAAGCIIIGLFPRLIIRRVLLPVANALFVPGQYDSALFAIDYQGILPELNMYVFWNPLIWLLSFFIILLGLLFAFKFRNKKAIKNFNTDRKDSENNNRKIFTGGETLNNLNPEADDLYWGIKHVFSPLFNYLRNIHSGIINDYVAWIVMTVVILNIYLLLTL